MKKLLLWLILFLVPSISYGKTISKIEIEGLKWTKESLIRKELLIHEGNDFSKEKLQKSI